MKLVLASSSREKMAEVKTVLKGLPVQLLSLSSFPKVKMPKETGKTFDENAVLKATSVAKQTGLPALADDSGLCVDYLCGAPGVKSARFAGYGASHGRKNKKLLNLLKGVPMEKRTACFVSVACLAYPPGPSGRQKIICRTGKSRGRIALAPRGKAGFGYDPVFIPSGELKTYAELGMRFKNKNSHRARAFRKMRRVLNRVV